MTNSKEKELMDPKLAELYGTNQVEEQDVEKLAAAELAETLTDDEEINLDNVDEETLEQLAQELLENEDEETVVEEPEASDDDEVKVAEADYLGRVMAHAFVQESREIEKNAGLKEVGKAIGRVGKKIHTKAQKLGKGVLNLGNKNRAGNLKTKMETKADLKASSKYQPNSKDYTVETHAKRSKDIADSRKGARKNYGRVLAATGYGTAAGATGLTGYAAKKGYDAASGKKKQASAIDTLALQRAEEILAENGVELEGQEQENVNPYDALATVVEQRAAEILVENGYELSEDNDE